MKKVSKLLLSFALVFAFALTTVRQVNAEAGQYEITFRAGSHGSFNGEKKISVKKAFGETFPDAPITTPDNGYRFKEWSKELPAYGSQVEGKAVYVAKWVPIVSGTEYRVRYVDQNDVDIITPRIVLGELGENVTERARTINDWPVDETEKTIKLTKGTNEIKFVYTVPEEEVQPIYTVEYQTNYIDQITVVTTPGGGAAGAATPAGAGAAGTPEVIGENETPQGDADEPTNIGDEETPQAHADKNSGNGKYIIYGAGAVGLIALLAFLLSKRKKQAESN